MNVYRYCGRICVLPESWQHCLREFVSTSARRCKGRVIDLLTPYPDVFVSWVSSFAGTHPPPKPKLQMEADGIVTLEVNHLTKAATDGF